MWINQLNTSMILSLRHCLAVVVFLSIPSVLLAQPNFFDHSRTNEPTWIKRHFVIEHADSLMDFNSHQSLNYRLNVERESTAVLHFRIEVKSRLPKPGDSYPLASVPDQLALYTQPSRYINSSHPTIVNLADSLLNLAPVNLQHELVWRVIRYTGGRLSWGDPSALPAATDAYESRVANCIGFTHLPAAILRHLGVPCRTVRTFMGLNLTPHYLLEVYYPSEDNWVTYDPQTGVPLPENIALYTHHDWDFEGQRRTRPMVTDPNITVYIGH